MRPAAVCGCALFFLLTVALPANAYDEQSGAVESAQRNGRHHLVAAADLSLVLANSDFDSWLYRGNGKLRYDEEHDGLRLNRIFLDYRGRISSTVSGRVVVNMNNDVSEKIDVTDAYIEWRPVPANAWRFRAKLAV